MGTRLSCLLLAFVFMASFGFAEPKIDSLIKSYEINLKKNPSDKKIRQKLIYLYQKKKKYSDIIKVAQAYIDELAHETLYIVADAYGQEKKYSSQIKTLNIILQTKDYEFLPHYLIALSYRDDKDTNKAIIHLRKSILLNKKHKPSFQALLNILIENKDYYEARIVLNDMKKTFGETSDILYQLCDLYYKDAYYQQAIETCQKSLSINSKSFLSQIQLAKSYNETKNDIKSKKTFLMAAGSFPKVALVQFEVGQYYYEKKNYATAIRYYNKALKINPKDSLSHLKIAESLFELNKYKEALTHYIKSCQLNRSDEAYTSFRNAASKLGQDIRSKWSSKYLSKVYLCQQEI